MLPRRPRRLLKIARTLTPGLNLLLPPAPPLLYVIDWGQCGGVCIACLPTTDPTTHLTPLSTLPCVAQRPTRSTITGQRHCCGPCSLSQSTRLPCCCDLRGGLAASSMLAVTDAPSGMLPPAPPSEAPRQLIELQSVALLATKSDARARWRGLCGSRRRLRVVRSSLGFSSR